MIFQRPYLSPQLILILLLVSANGFDSYLIELKKPLLTSALIFPLLWQMYFHPNPTLIIPTLYTEKGPYFYKC